MVLRRRHKPIPATLREVREALGISQGDVARHQGTSQPAVLKAERAADPRLSTLQRYVRAAAASTRQSHDLRMVATIGEQTFELRFPAATERSAAAPIDIEASPTAALSSGGVVHSTTPVWRLRAWKDADLEQRWLDEHVVSMTEDELGDLAKIPSSTDDAIKNRLRKTLPRAPERGFGVRISYLRAFTQHVQQGDILVVPLEGRRVAVGQVVGDYVYRPEERDPRLRHLREMIWHWVGPRDDLDDDIKKVANAPGTICRISYPDAALRLVR